MNAMKMFPVRCVLRVLVPVIICCLNVSVLQAQGWLSGQVMDEAGEGVAFSTVVIDDGKAGTITDQNGRFRLFLTPGSYQVHVSHIGFQSRMIPLDMTQSSITLEITLIEEVLSLEEVVIVPGGEDPAYAIMREAIRRKEFNQQISDVYSFDAYTKSVFALANGFSLDSMVKTFSGGQEIDLGKLEREPIFRTSILYLAETSSRVWKGRGNQEREVIKKSRTSGIPANQSTFGGLLTDFDPYQNLYFKGEIAERGVTSPLADQAMLYYRYKLLGVLKVDGQSVYKIEVTPKRMGDAVVQGILHIADSSYAVQSVDVWVTKRQAVQMIDSMRVTQTFLSSDTRWIPVSTRIHTVISLDLLAFKFPVSGTLSSIFSEYRFDEELPKNFFTSEIITVADTATVQDTAWWETNRPFQLRPKEALDYQLKDSVATLQSTPEYLDSLTKAQPFPGPLELWTGFTRRNFRTGTEWHWAGFRTSGFNAIEGWFLESDLSLDHPLSKQITWNLGSKLRYGFASKRFHYSGKLGLSGSGFRPWSIHAQAGDYPAEFSNIPQILPFANTYASMVHHRSHVRMFQSRFWSVGGTWEPVPGLFVEGEWKSERRTTLENTSEYSIRFKDRVYEDNFSIDDHRADIGRIRLSYQPYLKYVRLPDGKISMGSGWPILQADLSWAPGFRENSPEYLKVSLGLRDDLPLGFLGTLSYRVTAGRFMVQNNTRLPDVFHFHGGETFFRMGEDFDEFFLMPYYSYSDDNPYIEAHLEHAFGILGVSRIPGLRKLKISEYVGAHGLFMENRSPYVEINYGIEMRLFKVMKLRLDMHWWLMGEERWLPYAFTWRPDSLLQLDN